METPSSSTRRVTRSQTIAAAMNNNFTTNFSKKIEESEKSVTKSRNPTGKKQQDRSALIDITNDSPIVGLAKGNLETPSSEMSKKRVNIKGKFGTPGSGEALLRGQVKTLLQKVEEEAEISKISVEKRPFLHLQGFGNSPLNLLAPTAANTPQILNLSCNDSNELAAGSKSEDKIVITQMVTETFERKREEGLESEKDLVSRSLFFDFSDKSEGCISSDSSSIWSIQVNASSAMEDDEDYEDKEGLEEAEEELVDDGEIGYDGGLVDEICEGIMKMNVNGVRKLVKPSGKHTRFMYDSDGELVEVKEEFVSSGDETPMGKQLCFHEEDSDEE